MGGLGLGAGLGLELGMFEGRSLGMECGVQITEYGVQSEECGVQGKDYGVRVARWVSPLLNSVICTPYSALLDSVPLSSLTYFPFFFFPPFSG